MRRRSDRVLWCFKKPDEVPHRVLAVLRMTKRKLFLNLIEVATPGARFGQIPRLLEVVHNRRNRSFRDTDLGRDVSEPRGWIGGDALQYVRVVGQEPPEMIAYSCT
jgi:hypothetical protein